MPPSVPLNHYLSSENQQNRTEVLFLLFHARIFRQDACFEHSNFFKVNSSATMTLDEEHQGKTDSISLGFSTLPVGGPSPKAQIQLRAF